jgi:uncharacterized membrane protein YgdD (TMEM256/DUF423 family)
VIAPQIWLFLGAVNGLVAVAAGAYGRHGLLDPFGREMFAIGSAYQLAHGLALLAVAWLAIREGKPLISPVHFAGSAFTIGTLMFSGSLYVLGVTGAVPFEGAAPVGGWLLMLGWLALILTAVRNLRRIFRTSRHR